MAHSFARSYAAADGRWGQRPSQLFLPQNLIVFVDSQLFIAHMLTQIIVIDVVILLCG